MRRLMMFLLLSAITLSWWEKVDAATYQCVLSAEQDAILAEELAYRHLTQTPQQAIQQLCARELRKLGEDQEARTIQDLNAMARISTPEAKDNAEAALAASITPPTITDIPNQTNNVAQAVTVPIVATNPYASELALSYRVSGLPPGVSFSTDATGAPQLSGKLTTAGTFNVTIEVYNVVNVKATETFTWQVNL